MGDILPENHDCQKTNESERCGCRPRGNRWIARRAIAHRNHACLLAQGQSERGNPSGSLTDSHSNLNSLARRQNHHQPISDSAKEITVDTDGKVTMNR